MSTTSKSRRTPRLLASVVCPGGQGDVSVYGNLLFMSVEQTRGRLDCGTGGVADRGQRGALPRRPHFRHQRRAASPARWRRCRPAAARTPTPWSRSRTTRTTFTSTARGTSTVRSGEELAGCSGGDPKDDPNTALFSIDVIQVPLARPQEAHDRQPAADLRGRGDRRHRRALAGRQPRRRARRRTRSPTSVTTSPSSRNSAWPPAPARATASCSTSPIRCTRCGSIAVVDKNFAYWHSATFNNDGTKVDLHRRMGRRHASALPRDRSADLGRRRHLRHRRSQAAVRAATTRCRRRRPIRRTASRTTGRSSPCPAATSWCRRGTRAACRCSTSPTRRSRSRSRSSTAVRSTPSS